MARIDDVIVRVDKYVSMNEDELWIDYATLIEILDKVYHISQRFATARGSFYDWLRSMLNSPYVLADVIFRLVRLQPYQVESWWERWLKRLQLSYAPQVFDCDNYAGLAASLAAAELSTNAVLRAWGEVQIGSETFGHAYNIVLALLHGYPEQGTAYVATWIFEPQTAMALMPGENGTAETHISGLGDIKYRTAAVLGW